MKVLIADDSDFARSTLKHMIADIGGIEYVEATNGIDTLEKHRSFYPDVIFLDLTMPYLDGLTTLRILRMIDDEVRIIVVSALVSQDFIVEECLSEGANGVVSKPYSRESLYNAFNSVGA